MIPAVAQTLAELLANGTSLISTEQINFDHPGKQQHTTPRLNLYCYDLRESIHIHYTDSLEHRISSNHSGKPSGSYSLLWFDVSFLVSAWDRTALGEQRLLSEALRSLLCHRSLREECLAIELRGYGNLLMGISTVPPIDTASLWSALGVPLRPALYVTVTIPFNLQGVAPRSTNCLQGIGTQPEAPE